MTEPRFFALDAEMAGPKVGRHDILSIGVTAVPRERKGFQELATRYTFYRELKPRFRSYDLEAIRVGASQLKCVKQKKKEDPRLDTGSPCFDPLNLLLYMQESDACVHIEQAFDDLGAWVRKHSDGMEALPVTDAVFFDPPIFRYAFGKHAAHDAPFKHTGICLRSYIAGLKGDPQFRLSSLNYPECRQFPHRADEDAAHLAMMAQEYLYA
jgi:hypothetical protein